MLLLNRRDFAVLGLATLGTSPSQAQAYFSGSDAPPQPANVPKPQQPLDTDTAPTWARLEKNADGPSLGFQWGDFYSYFDMPPSGTAKKPANVVLTYTGNRGYKFTQQLTKEWMKVRFRARPERSARAPRALYRPPTPTLCRAAHLARALCSQTLYYTRPTTSPQSFVGTNTATIGL
jgi:hypothetical protein